MGCFTHGHITWPQAIFDSQTLRVTSALEAGIDNHVWSLVEIVNVLSCAVNNDANSITMWSGDKCDTAGYYWSSGCGHAEVMEFSEYEEFPNCKTCNQLINWIHRPTAKD